MADQMFEAVEDVAREGMVDVQSYFRREEVLDDPKERHIRVDRAIKLLSIYSRTRATRANEMSVAVLMAKLMGLRGEALAPVWEQLTGRAAQQFLPPREQSGEKKSTAVARKPRGR